MKAYAVTENSEGTGAIFFAKHAIAAAIRGANEYADGDLTSVSCRRAPWADEYADTQAVPVSDMIYAGWNFECHGCGVRIDSDLPEACDDPERYRDWLPAHILGTQHGTIFCDARCEQEHIAAKARKEQVEAIIRAKYRRIIERRFPGAGIEGKGHVYVTERDQGGRSIWRVESVAIQFDFPGRKYALAELRFDYRSSYGKDSRRISTRCSNGDFTAFNAWRNRHLAKNTAQSITRFELTAAVI